MSNLSLSIAFFLGWPDINGGTYVIYEHGTRLQKRGHRVTMITENEINPSRYSWHSKAAELDWLTLAQAATEKFDIVVATWWESPFLLHQVSASHYLYFVQKNKLCQLCNHWLVHLNNQTYDALFAVKIHLGLLINNILEVILKKKIHTTLLLFIIVGIL